MTENLESPLNKFSLKIKNDVIDQQFNKWLLNNYSGYYKYAIIANIFTSVMSLIRGLASAKYLKDHSAYIIINAASLIYLLGCIWINKNRKNPQEMKVYKNDA